MAQAYQESGLDQSKRSPEGAIGVMQILPATAADRNVAIDDIHLLEPNIHAGVKYLRFLRDRYFDEPGIADLDRLLFAFAAYNAGPRNVARARTRATRSGFDPDIWFNNVEIAAGRAISREPVTYVRNIYKYYVAYRLMTL
jgi:membrane-bound lytic murein transglycosylase MltF